MNNFRNAAVLLSLTLSYASGAYAGLIGYNVSVNTAPIAGQMGFVDFTYLAGSAAAPPSTATVSSFTRAGGTLGAATLSGNVMGALPGTLTLGNAGGFNDIFQAVTFGTQYSFQTLLNTPVPNASNVGTRFSFSLYGADGITPLLTVDPGGAVLDIDVSSAGVGRITTFASSAAGGAPIVTVSTVPEPGAAVLLLSGLGAILFRRLRKTA